MTKSNKMSREEFLRITAPSTNKYRTSAREFRRWEGYFNGRNQVIQFDSKSEHRRFLVLLDLFKCGAISYLEIQPKFQLGTNEAYYGDFLYRDKVGEWICEDVKAVQTPLFRSKWKRVIERNPNIQFLLIDSKST